LSPKLSVVSLAVQVANIASINEQWATESGFQIVYSRSNNDSELWTEASLISAQGTRSSHPRVIAMNDTFLVLWTESDKTGHRLKMKRLVSE